MRWRKKHINIFMYVWKQSEPVRGKHKLNILQCLLSNQITQLRHWSSYRTMPYLISMLQSAASTFIKMMTLSDVCKRYQIMFVGWQKHSQILCKLSSKHKCSWLDRCLPTDSFKTKWAFPSVTKYGRAGMAQGASAPVHVIFAKHNNLLSTLLGK